MSGVTLMPAIETLAAYAPPRHPAGCDLDLSSNLQVPFDASVLAALARDAALQSTRYPDAAGLERLLAARYGVEPERVLVTAGGDDAIQRACRAVLGPGREAIVADPVFEILTLGIEACGASLVRVPWPVRAPFPVAEVCARVGARTALIAVVSPNNPTGAVAPAPVLCALSESAPEALLLADFAYVDFAAEDPTPAALQLPNCVVVRTLSKAWGMPGLRIGFALGPASLIAALRRTGLPYSVASASVAIASAWFETGAARVAARIARVRSERETLGALLERLGANPDPSQASFVLARPRDPTWLADGMAGLGIRVRRLTTAVAAREGGAGERGGIGEQGAGGKRSQARFDPAPPDAVRIACPGDERAFDRLTDALNAVLAPQALLFDLDGVLADVSRSYRRAIAGTAAEFGVPITAADIAAAKRAGGANNDWLLTQRLLAMHGVRVSLPKVRVAFERLYQGDATHGGLWQEESPLVDAALLARWAGRLPLAVVTGRPRADAERFLAMHAFMPHVRVLVTMEDAPSKPDPAPVRLALDRLGVRHAWLLGDTPDDVGAARAAGVVPLAVVAPGDDTQTTAAALQAAGVARILDRLADLEELLP